MTDINFGSTYRIPITQAGVNPAKKAKLKQLIETYPNGMIGNSKVGNARVSMPDSEDENFIRKLKGIGYKIYQKFEGENISKENLDAFIKEKLDTRDFNQKGKPLKRMSTKMKEQRRYERNFTLSENVKKDINLAEENITALEPKQEVQPQRLNTGTEKKSDARFSPQNDEEFKNTIRQSAKYLEFKEKYGEEFAEGVYFGIKK